MSLDKHYWAYMMFCDFKTSTHGKWVLVGEHAVLRGNAAVVYPLRDRRLILNYTFGDHPLNVMVSGEQVSDIHGIFLQVLSHASKCLGQSNRLITGTFLLENNIPLGVGMGASAALSVAVARWFAARDNWSTDQTVLFARELENLFHGKSSGLDIAGVSAISGVVFQQGNSAPIEQCWQPNFALSSSGEVGLTAACIERVQHLWITDRTQALSVDAEMQASVVQAIDALKNRTQNALIALSQAMNRASDCFVTWGLVSDALKNKMQILRDAGALAVKPTGSGLGGMIISLWKDPIIPQIDNTLHLI